MSGPAPLLFVFRIPVTGPSGSSTFACMATSIDEARSHARAVGHHHVALIDQRHVEAIDPAALDARVRGTPGLGPEWTSVVDVLDVVMGRLALGPVWTLRVYGEAYGYDPNETPGLQGLRRADGSLDLEVTGRRSPMFEGTSLDLGEWTVMPAGDGPFIPTMSRHYEPGWQREVVAVDGLAVLTNAYGITNRDFFLFGESIADEVDALGLMERAGDGPQFRLRTGPAGREVAAPRQQLPSQQVVDAFVDSSARIGVWDEEELARRRARGRWSVDTDAYARVEAAVHRMGAEEVLETLLQRLRVIARGDHSEIALRTAGTALLARAVLAPEDYRSLTTGFATAVGRAHPDDDDRIAEHWGPRGAEVRAFYDQVQHLTPRQSVLIPLYREATEREWEELRAKAKGRLLAARRALPWPLTFDPGPDAGDLEDGPEADTLLGIISNDLAGDDDGFDAEDSADLTVVLADVLGRIGTVQVRDPGYDAGPQQYFLDELLERVDLLDEDEIARLQVEPRELLQQARVAAWTTAQTDFREGPWIRGDELPVQAAADAADALVVRDRLDDITDSGSPATFTQEQYDLLSGPWRRTIGPIHPDDPDLRTPSDATQGEPEMVPASDPDDVLFPWLRSASARADAGLVEQGSSSTAEAIVGIVLMQLDTWSLGDVFPALAESDWPSAATLPVRLGNRIAGGGELRSMCARDLLQMRNVGATSVERLLIDLVERTRRTAREGGPVLAVRIGSEAVGTVEPSAGPLVDPAVGTDLLQLADWSVLIGSADRPLLSPGGFVEPDDVIEARERLLGLTASVIDQPVRQQRLGEVLTAHVGALDDRVTQILAARLFARRPVTLEELGTRFGVTRERIRQLESAGRTRLWQAVNDDPRLASVVRAVVSGLPPIRSLTRLLEWMPALADEVGGLAEPAWFVLDRLDDAWEAEDGWIGTPSLAAAREATREQLSALADPHGVVDLDELVSSPGALEDLDPTELRAWCIACGYAVHDRHLLMRSRGLLDWAEALLAIAGEPTTSDALIAAIPLDRSVRSLRNALGDDDRFVAVDRERWALSEWGMPEYGSVRHQIGVAVDESDDGVPLADLITALTSRFGVAQGSVVAYATSGEFAVVDGVVRRVEFRIAAPRKTAARTRRLYRTEGGWAFRVQVSADHLRGSGFPVPIALFSELRSDPGDRRIEFESEDGIVPLIWNGTQAACGSIRRFLLARGAAIGDEALLRFEEGRFSLGTPELDPDDPVSTACELVGVQGPMDFKEARGAIGPAIGRPRADWPTLIRWAEERDDLDVADLMRTALVERENAVTWSGQGADDD